jgi:hypothetical protein
MCLLIETRTNVDNIRQLLLSAASFERPSTTAPGGRKLRAARKPEDLAVSAISIVGPRNQVSKLVKGVGLLLFAATALSERSVRRSKVAGGRPGRIRLARALIFLKAAGARLAGPGDRNSCSPANHGNR